MYWIEEDKKRDPVRRWNLPDRVFFACGACQVLAFAFLERHAGIAARAMWIKPDAGYTGNHIFIDGGSWVFDYHGYAVRDALLEHTRRKARRWWPGWEAQLIELAADVLVSEVKSRNEGLWLREPKQFLHDALPRARAYLDRFPPPPQTKGSA